MPKKKFDPATENRKAVKAEARQAVFHAAERGNRLAQKMAKDMVKRAAKGKEV